MVEINSVWKRRCQLAEDDGFNSVRVVGRSELREGVAEWVVRGVDDQGPSVSCTEASLLEAFELEQAAPAPPQEWDRLASTGSAWV